MINLIGLAFHMVWYINTCRGLWFNGVRQNRETNEEHDEDCAVVLKMAKCHGDGEGGGRKALDMGNCSINI